MRFEERWRFQSSIKRALAGISVLLTAAVLLQAQPDGVELHGRVVAETGQPLPQATVTFLNVKSGLRMQSSTDAQGYYRLTGLTAGQYHLEAEAKGYLVEMHDEVSITANGTLEINFRLREARKTIREVEEQGAQERNPNIFIRRIDLNALREPLRRRGIDPVFVPFGAVENNYGSDMGAPIRQILFVAPGEPRSHYHGSVYEFHQNNHLNARPFFNVGPLRPSKRNQFGFITAGPLLTQASFFTTTLEFVRDSGYVNGNIRAPLLTERTPQSGNADTDRVIALLLQAYPAEQPNLPNVTPRQMNTNAMRRISSTDWNFKPEYVFSQDNRLAFRYAISDFHEEPFELVAGQNPKTRMRSQTFSAVHSLNRTTKTSLTSSFYFDRLAAELVPTDHYQKLLKPLGLKDVPDLDFGGTLGDLTAIGPGTQFPRLRYMNRFAGNFDVGYQARRHRLHIGSRIVRVQLNDLQSDNSRGKFSFTNNFGRTPLENFLLGTPTRFTLTVGDPYRGFRNWEHALYVQDSCELRRGLTLTLGLRYEIVTVPVEVADRMRFDFKTDANNLGPQIGFAWALPGNTTVIRGGYGIAYAHIFPGTYQQARFNPPAVKTISVQNPSLLNPLQGVNLSSGQQRWELNLISPDLVSPYSQQYNLLIERRLLNNLVFRVGYIGNRTLKTFFPLITNRAEPVPGIPSTTATIDQRRPDQRYLNIQTLVNMGIYYYDGMKASLTRSFSSGLSFEVTYVLSKLLTSAGSDFANTLNRETGTNNSQNSSPVFPDLKAAGQFDHRHALTVQYTYRLPFHFASSRLAATLFGNWHITGIMELRTGLWYGVLTGSDAPGFGNVDGVDGDRPNIVKPGLVGMAVDNPDTAPLILRPEYFNTDIPAGGRGNISVASFRRDTINNTNLTVQKSFPVGKSERSLQMSAEFLNLFNHPLFERPGDVFPSEVFGKIVDTQNKGRVTQLQLKYNF